MPPRIHYRFIQLTTCLFMFSGQSLAPAGAIPDLSGYIDACNLAYAAQEQRPACVITQVHVDKSANNPFCFDYRCGNGPGTWTQVASGSAPGRYLYTWSFVPDDLRKASAEGRKVAPQKVQAAIDWKDSGAHPLNFTRYHRDQGNLPVGLGQAWSHNYAAALSTGQLSRVVRLGDGTRVVFRRSAPDAPWFNDGGKDALLETAEGPVYVRASDESRWQFAQAGGRLTSITQRNGWRFTLGYKGSQLVSVTNSFGRTLAMSYDTQGRLSSVAASGFAPLSYSYDGIARLMTVRYPDTTSRTYLYEANAPTSALSGIVNQDGLLLATFSAPTAPRGPAR